MLKKSRLRETDGQGKRAGLWSGVNRGGAVWLETAPWAMSLGLKSGKGSEIL